jgi:hypothetical protein
VKLFVIGKTDQDPDPHWFSIWFTYLDPDRIVWRQKADHILIRIKNNQNLSKTINEEQTYVKKTSLLKITKQQFT